MTINEAIQEFEDNAYHHSKHPVVSDEAMAVALKAMREIARGQRPELEHAEWKVTAYNAGFYVAKCSNCDIEHVMSPHLLSDYCPNCGAKMDGGGEL